MKKFLLIYSLLLSFFASAQIDKVIPKRSSPPKLVTDVTATLTPAQQEALENKLKSYDDSTSTQIAVVIIKTLGDYTDQEVALEILRKWGVGNKDKNNGIVLLVAKDDRKIRIETGYGMEGVIPDVTAKSIIENEIKPSFKQDDYYRGLDHGVDAMIRAAAGEYKAPANYGSKKKDKVPTSIIILIVVFILIFVIGGNSTGGTYVSRGGYTGWSGGGGSSGGWSGGGGGGFGGFGGGSGGGGGASGSW